VDRADSEQEVIQFIVEHVHTVPHLEALLLIWQNPSTPWTSDSLAARIYVTPIVGRSILEELSALGVLKPSADSTFHYDSAWDERRQLLPSLADLYRRQLVQVTKLIHSKGSSSVREFARAFQIKKEH
jgi:hypothetical protein